MLDAFTIDETLSLAVTVGCLAGALFLHVVTRLDDWRRWKFHAKTRLREIFGDA